MLVVVDWLCHDHVFVHENDSENLTRFIRIVSGSLMKSPARMEADFTCSIHSYFTCKVQASALFATYTASSTY